MRTTRIPTASFSAIIFTGVWGFEKVYSIIGGTAQKPLFAMQVIQ